jgi:hypothetical protein
MTSTAILGDPYEPPETIMCDYEGGLSAKLGSIGKEIVVKNTFWTAYALADAGDYLLIGDRPNQTRLWPVPTRCGRLRAGTFDGLEDDYAIITGV